MDLILVRGVSGSGKTTIANLFGGKIIAADDYFGEGYEFDPSKLPHAHEFCYNTVSDWMSNGEPKIVVHNTFTRDSEMENYFSLAEEKGYTVHTVIVENRHGSSDTHGVPEQVKEKQESRFSIKLR